MNDKLTEENPIWDMRAEGLRDPRAIFPPVKCMMVNAQNERIPAVFYVNFRSGLVGKFVCWQDEYGLDVYGVEPFTKEDGEIVPRLIPEWITVPGVKWIPLPAGYEEEITEKRKKKRFKADSSGQIELQF